MYGFSLKQFDIGTCTILEYLKYMYYTVLHVHIVHVHCTCSTCFHMYYVYSVPSCNTVHFHMYTCVNVHDCIHTLLLGLLQ